MIISKDELDQFEKSFPELLDDMAKQINPRESRRISRKGLGKIIDVAILLRRGFDQSWQFVVVIQALFVFLGLAPQVSESLAQFGINITGTMIGLLALGGIIFFFIFGLALLLYGGTQRSTALINEKQAPAQRMNYNFYKAMAKWAKNANQRLDKIEKKLDEISNKGEK
ncbi:hypothetical protein AKJ50_02060 [candidate division MSBL1 archaeon SCGC-AAA382A13]|uniref:Uncharacterized protein n=1 Tax=candidate division MSBL1 archaeon SCGC-AAA382A13 TaxID=1698279 RepID=A0A133VE60_9EURY|nr:hypothetical protein AKJ50_02060 [candidate division MSBL1 archaeon SCGC-AAA382A13]